MSSLAWKRIWIGLALPWMAFGEAGELQVGESGTSVALSGQAGLVLSSPPEGLWSVGLGWKDGWPETWHHAQPVEIVHAGEWTILKGEIALPEGVWKVSDSYRPREGYIEGRRRFEWTGDKPLAACTLSVRFQTPLAGAGVVMPGILYHGNPSGAKSGRTPVYTGAAGEEAYFEEHRFPMPFVSIEGDGQSAALHSLPSPAPFGHREDQWWSMGVTALEQGTELTLLSGPCASNGQRSVVKAVQPGFIPYDEAYLEVPPGAIIEKMFYLQQAAGIEAGSGFRPAVALSLQLFDPVPTKAFPSFADIIEAKYRFALSRWHEDGVSAGFKKFPDKDIYVLGWCGQAAAPGYALQVLADRLGDPGALDKVQRSLDFLSTAEFYEGGFHTWYHCDTKTWDRHEPLSQGQAMLHVADAVRVGWTSGRDTTRWEAFLRKACGFHAERILAADWRPKSTDEAFFIAPLCAGADLFDAPRYREAAVKAGEVYAARHLSMEEPYWGGTLDASCEDKEGAFAAFQGFLALYDATGEDRFLRWANHACDVALTYTVVWDIDLPPGRLRDHAFKTRGWTAVSVQNMHVDVYGVLIAPWVYRLGQITARDDLKDLALLMFRSCGQLLDPYGSQGEQPQHTNYAQRGKVEQVSGLRGGYVEDWTVFWITAHFLNAAARLEELGAPVWED